MDISKLHTYPARRQMSPDDLSSPPSSFGPMSLLPRGINQPRRAMDIPGIRSDNTPPPLPPPRFNEDLARGIDVAWNWGNSNPFEDQSRRLAPITVGSSLHGNYPRPSQLSATGFPSEPNQDDDDDGQRRGSSASTLRPPSQPEIFPREQLPSLVWNSTSPKDGSQRLHGEMPLAQKNNTHLSQQYDQRLLSKIGKAPSSQRKSHTKSAEISPLSAKLSLQTPGQKSPRLSNGEAWASSSDPVTRWITSATSTGLSASPAFSWRGHSGPRSPSMDSTGTSGPLDHDFFVPSRATRAMSSEDASSPRDEAHSGDGHHHQPSYEQGVFPETMSDIAHEDGHTFRNLNLGRASLEVINRPSHQRLKRRALSPPSGVGRDDKSVSRGILPTDPTQLANTTSSVRSPIVKYQSKHGSFSSTSSSVRQNSYTSSISFSVAGSSITSVSSSDHLSSLDQSQPVYPSSHIVSSPATSVRSKPGTTQVRSRDRAVEAMSTADPLRERKEGGKQRFGLPYMCECCPKKPKRFDTEAKLREHQKEKQFTCQYCNNRFKNKNEAERHQNSLHLRRQSWSCAAISTYEAAFHPSASGSPSSQTSSPTDTCGYCGEEFPNFPQPDWRQRGEHLMNMHKFNECNHSKKFYRADHFRQHLKHSHGGQSGKWTNILETTSLRIESDIAPYSPAGSETSSGRAGGGLADPPMGGISEAIDET